MSIEKKIEKSIISTPPIPVQMDYGIDHYKIWKGIQRKYLIYKGEPKKNKYLIYKGEKYKLTKCKI